MMGDQIDFNFGSERLPLNTDAGFSEWMRTDYGKNVAKEFVRRAKELRAKGVFRFGAMGIAAAMRYDHAIEFGDKGNDPYRINNNAISRLARWAMREHPELQGMFSKRTQRGEENAA